MASSRHGRRHWDITECFLTRWEQKSGRQPVLPSKTVGGKDQFDDLPNDRSFWRDLNGDGKAQGNEPSLKGFVYWDKNGDGEHNSSNEPIVKTNDKGALLSNGFGTLPNLHSIGFKITGLQREQTKHLVPIYPPPPPPENPELVRNFHILIKKPGILNVPIAYRAAPVLKGSVWTDANGNGIREKTESGSASSTLFLDRNGNFQLDENETSFKPGKDGTFEHLVSPGQHSLCIKPDNSDANVTFPIETKKAYLAWVDFESTSDQLDFGVQEPSSENQNQQESKPEQSQSQEAQSDPCERKNRGKRKKRRTSSSGSERPL